MPGGCGEADSKVSTHMPLARHDTNTLKMNIKNHVSTHMPLARHDPLHRFGWFITNVSTHMPLARHDGERKKPIISLQSFYSHASCEA